MRGVGPGSGFWIVAVVFVVTMAYSTVPTPLYPLYEQRDDFPVSLVTVIYSAFAVGVMLSLYLFGHVSDWLGRRTMLVIAVGISIVSAGMFLLWPETAGLIAARAVNGVSIGILSATATAHLGELRAIARPQESPVFATSVAGAANLGGLALGSLIGGLLAEVLPDPLVLPHVLFLVLLVVAGARPAHRARDGRAAHAPSPVPAAEALGAAGGTLDLPRGGLRRVRRLRGLRTVQLAGADLPRGRVRRAGPPSGRRHGVRDLRRLRGRAAGAGRARGCAPS